MNTRLPESYVDLCYRPLTDRSAEVLTPYEVIHSASLHRAVVSNVKRGYTNRPIDNLERSASLLKILASELLVAEVAASPAQASS